MDRRMLCELLVDGNRWIEWLRSEARAQRESMRNRCLVFAVLAGGFVAVRLVQGREQSALAGLVLAVFFLGMWVLLVRPRVEEAARRLMASLRDRPEEIRRIAHVVYGRRPFRTNEVVIEGDGGGFLTIATRHWDLVLNVLAARCRAARVELCASRVRRLW